MNLSQIEKEQAACLTLKRGGASNSEIAKKTGLTAHQVRRRLSAAYKRERLDPALMARLKSQGINDLSGLHSGWLLEKDSDGTGSSLYFYLGPDQERIDFADAVKEVLSEIPRLPALTPAAVPESGIGYANWMFLADLHLGAHYGDTQIEIDVQAAIDDLARRMPPAEKAVLFEMGDLLDANDHKGVTPASGNNCDVIRENVLGNTKTAVRLMKYAAYRLMETHNEVEIHLIPGNHDRSAFVAVMIALEEHFANNPHVNVVVTDDEFRCVSWGQCACFPHHGDTLKWAALKDVWADQFSDEWSKAKVFRLIATAHLHHDRRQDLVGASAEHFRTLHRPNAWARGKGLFSYASIDVLTIHKFRGPEHRTMSPIKPMLKGK